MTDHQGKWFFIRSVANEGVLDIEGGPGGYKPGTAVITWPNKSSYTDRQVNNQQWYVDRATDTIRSKMNGHCLTLNENDQLVMDMYRPNDYSQQWVVFGQRVQHKQNTVFVLEVEQKDNPAGARIFTSIYSGKPSQHWLFQYLPAQPFYAKSKSDNANVLTVKSNQTGAEVTMTKREDERKDQLWYEDKYGNVRSLLNDMVLDSGKVPGKVSMQEYSGSALQSWTVDGERITNFVRPDRVLEIPGTTDSMAYEGNWNYVSPMQQWDFEYIS